MERSYRYCVLRFTPDPVRGETVNIGIVVFLDGRTDVRITKQLSKAQALVPNMSLGNLDQIREEISEICEGLPPDEAVHLLHGYAPFSCSGIGYFSGSHETYEAKLEETMRRLVNPPRRQSMNEGRSRLHTEIKQIFRKYKLLGTSPDQISSHKVIPSYTLPGEEDLAADFAIKNGLWRLTQVLDYRTTLKGAHAKIKEVSMKSVAIHQAPTALEVPRSEVKGYALVWVPDEYRSIADPHFRIMSDFGVDILHYDRPEDRRKYWDNVAQWIGQDSRIQ